MLEQDLHMMRLSVAAGTDPEQRRTTVEMFRTACYTYTTITVARIRWLAIQCRKVCQHVQEDYAAALLAPPLVLSAEAQQLSTLLHLRLHTTEVKDDVIHIQTEVISWLRFVLADFLLQAQNLSPASPHPGFPRDLAP